MEKLQLAARACWIIRLLPFRAAASWIVAASSGCFAGGVMGISIEERSLSQSPRSPGAVARAPFLSICVTDPVKMGMGIQSYISYHVITKVIRLVLCSKSWISRFYDVETLAGVAWSLVPLAAANATLQANGTTRMLAAASAALQADNTVRAVAQCPPWNITVAECALCLYNSVQDFVTPVSSFASS
ncbi:putative PX protein [Hordeum vulgare]|nr:putative PX protein [Hordeum vulgare]